VDATVSWATESVVVSAPRDEGAGFAVKSVTIGELGRFPERTVVELSADGTDEGFVPVPLAQPMTLTDQWRWRVRFTDDLLDAGSLDQIEVSW